MGPFTRSLHDERFQLENVNIIWHSFLSVWKLQKSLTKSASLLEKFKSLYSNQTNGWLSSDEKGKKFFQVIVQRVAYFLDVSSMCFSTCKFLIRQASLQ